jgi:hypothetical protein
LARSVHDDRTYLDPDAGGERETSQLRVLATEVGDAALNSERGSHRSLRVVLLSDRIAEQCHDPVAEGRRDVTAHLRDRRRRIVQIRAYEVPPILGVERGRKAGRADDVVEQDRDVATFGGVIRHGNWRVRA